MEKSHLIFELSPWFILASLVAGAGYAYLLYQKNGPWSDRINYLLAGLRFLLVSALCFLLIGPIIKQISNSVEKPYVVIAIDNSQSVAEVVDSSSLSDHLESTRQLARQLQDGGFSVEYRTFDTLSNEIDEIAYDHHVTPLNELLQQIQSDYEGRNLTSLVLVSDGIYTKGLSPAFVPYNFKIHTVGIGDTIPQRDLNLRALYFNKIAYQGNRFIIKAEIQNHGFIDQQVLVTVNRGQKVIKQQQLDLTQDNQINTINFTIDADRKGLQDYSVQINPLQGEFTTNNNTRHAYIDVVEGKKNILLAARAPHPDIKAIKNAIEKNQNYQVVRFIPGIDQWKAEDYDLLILHRITERQSPKPLRDLLSVKPKWMILGGRVDINAFNQSEQLLQVRSINNQKDQVTPVINNTFSKFTLSEEISEFFEQVSPISVPFGNYKLIGNTEVLLNQRVGSLSTEKPLLAVADGEQKVAVLLGDGIWQWRLQEYFNRETTQLFDEMVAKLVQYLASKDDKRQFRVYPIKNEFDISEPVVLEAEVYDDVFERVYGNQIDLEVIPESGSGSEYTFVTSENNSQYNISGLEQGIFRFRATTDLAGQNAVSSGQFTIQAQQLENIELTANHALLRQVSERSGGKFFLSDQWPELSNTLSNQSAQGLIYSEEAFAPIIKLPWALLLLLLLAGTEWVVRKYFGSY